MEEQSPTVYGNWADEPPPTEPRNRCASNPKNSSEILKRKIMEESKKGEILKNTENKFEYFSGKICELMDDKIKCLDDSIKCLGDRIKFLEEYTEKKRKDLDKLRNQYSHSKEINRRLMNLLHEDQPKYSSKKNGFSNLFLELTRESIPQNPSFSGHGFYGSNYPKYEFHRSDYHGTNHRRHEIRGSNYPAFPLSMRPVIPVHDQKKTTQVTPREATQVIPREVTLVASKGETQVIPREVTLVASKGETQVIPREVTPVIPREAILVASKGETQIASKGETQIASKGETQDIPKKMESGTKKKMETDIPEKTEPIVQKKKKSVIRKRTDYKQKKQSDRLFEKIEKYGREMKCRTGNGSTYIRIILNSCIFDDEIRNIVLNSKYYYSNDNLRKLANKLIEIIECCEENGKVVSFAFNFNMTLLDEMSYLFWDRENEKMKGDNFQKIIKSLSFNPSANYHWYKLLTLIKNCNLKKFDIYLTPAILTALKNWKINYPEILEELYKEIENTENGKINFCDTENKRISFETVKKLIENQKEFFKYQ